jgi:hypothetical protein
MNAAESQAMLEANSQSLTFITGQDAITVTFHYANRAIAGQIGILRKVKYNGIPAI